MIFGLAGQEMVTLSVAETEILERKKPYDIWASSRQNLSSGFPTRPCSNQPALLQRQARKLKFCLKKVQVWYFPKKKNNKGADQSVRMRRLVCDFCLQTPNTGFSRSRPISLEDKMGVLNLL